MSNLKVVDIIKATKGVLITGDKEIECENFAKDTRIIQKNDIYIGIKGDNFDGNLFWRDALNKGALGVIAQNIDITSEEKEKYTKENKIIIEVNNTLQALYDMAIYKRDLYNIPVIAITGSVGKTSTKDIVASVVSQKYKTLKTEGNNNNNIGLPFTILKLKDHEAMVLEMGMNHFKEISLLTKIAKPTLAIITNIGTSHIGILGSRENILKAKLEILEGMNNPKIIINNDNDLLHNWYEQNNKKIDIYTFGLENKSDIIAEDIELEGENSSFNAIINNEKINIKVPVGGIHFVYNALCATEVGKLLNLSNEQIQEGISKFELTKKRMDIQKKENGAIIINDSYNASYESMEASLKYLSDYNGKRKIAVLGDMFELGEYADELHKKVGEQVAKNNIDVLICSGEKSKYIIEKAIEYKPKLEKYWFESNNKIEQKLHEILTKGDVVLIKASNGMKFYEICQKL